MRNVVKLSLATALLILSIAGCKRETISESTKNKQPELKNGAVNPAPSKSGNTIYYKATEEEIEKAKNKWLRDAKAQASATENRGGCGNHVSDLCLLIEVTGTCSSTSWDIKYRIYSFDEVGSGYDPVPQSATFLDMFGFPVTSTLLNYTATLDDPDCKNWYFDGYCDMMRVYNYQLTGMYAPASAWPASIGTYNLQLLSGFSSNCTPLTASGNLKGGFTAAEYQNMPARVYVSPTGGNNLFIGTDCSILCPPPYIVCPSSGSFTYWDVNNPGNTTTVNFGSSGTIIPVSPGNYAYSCTLTYIIGGVPVVTAPLTGTFTI